MLLNVTLVDLVFFGKAVATCKSNRGECVPQNIPAATTMHERLLYLPKLQPPHNYKYGGFSSFIKEELLVLLFFFI